MLWLNLGGHFSGKEGGQGVFFSYALENSLLWLHRHWSFLKGSKGKNDAFRKCVKLDHRKFLIYWFRTPLWLNKGSHGFVLARAELLMIGSFWGHSFIRIQSVTLQHITVTSRSPQTPVITITPTTITVFPGAGDDTVIFLPFEKEGNERANQNG